MFRFISFLVLPVFLAAFVAAHKAQAEEVASGAVCDRIGSTRMTSDHGAIVTCLLSTSDESVTTCSGGNCKWMSAGAGTSTGAKTCPSGFLIVGSADRPWGCIQANENDSRLYYDAHAFCYEKYKARLPLAGELYAAAHQHKMSFGAGAHPCYDVHTHVEWVDGVFIYYGGEFDTEALDQDSYAPGHFPGGLNSPYGLEYSGFPVGPHSCNGGYGTSYRFRCFIPAR
ncbi:MAG: hypothetical protein WC464_09280 [Bdellovibrionales bacterium]